MSTVFFFQAEDGIRDLYVTGVQTCALPISFSTCCGVHARLDLPPSALSTPPVTSGTTNVDFNPPMRAALAGAVATASQILLKVGDEEVTAVTEATSVTERKVDLPARWIKGFGEVSALHASTSTAP